MDQGPDPGDTQLKPRGLAAYSPTVRVGSLSKTPLSTRISSLVSMAPIAPDELHPRFACTSCAHASYQAIVIASQRVRADARPHDRLREAIQKRRRQRSGLLRCYAPRNDDSSARRANQASDKTGAELSTMAFSTSSARKFAAPKNRFCRPSQSHHPCPVLCPKIFHFLFFRIDVYFPRPASHEGRFAIVTNVGCGMRWARRVAVWLMLHGRTSRCARSSRVVLASRC
jgi:hypothetical protein